uniref:Uncharacterized protein n=1 Tax=Siphoviridae sp. ctBCr48 TaxID=2827802 RepID=A0A8S5SHP0_9CAUD|nr:MAG TPA: hypothetical protein [Siphoviridae sp. ctBCr48]
MACFSKINKKFIIIFAKPLDKQGVWWYNIYVKKTKG